MLVGRISIALAISSTLAACSAQQQVGYVAGAINAEDLAPVPGTRWLLASGLDEEGIPGRITLIDREAKTARVLFSADAPVLSDQREGDPACPAPLAKNAFGAHGVAVRETAPGKGLVYAINHTGREAVEIFALDWSGGQPGIAWTGCVPLPARVLSNGVATLPDGGLAVTWMNAPEYFASGNGRADAASWIPKFVAGETTGYAATWRPGEGWRRVPGSEGSVPNGIAASPDGRHLYVALWRNREVRRVALDGGPARSATLDFMPDNLHWGDDGRLWTAGATGEAEDYFACTAKPGCHNAYAIASLDPGTMKVEAFAHPDTRPAFGDGTGAVKAGDEVWVGSNPADKVAWFKAGR